ncbi:MAG: type II secretion system GspH family protein [Spirochaetes bacterium]|nr:type II secretion system GspH family protein [Spirochaetota bacterium]
MHSAFAMGSGSASFRIKRKKGFALIEILIAASILSIILISVFTGVSSSIYAMAGSKNYTKAMMIAKSKMNEFILKKMREPDVNKEPVEGYTEFLLTRETKRFEHTFTGPIPTNITEITVSWKERERDKTYKIFYIYAQK